MTEPEKKRRFSSIFKTKESSGKLTTSTGSAGGSGSGNGGAPEEEGPRGARRKLLSQLSDAEKSMRRSTLGSATLSQAANNPANPTPPAPTGQLTGASTASKGVLFSRPTQPAAAAPELETPFAKMVRQSGTTPAGTRDTSSTTGSLARTPSNPDSAVSEAPSGGTRRSSTLNLSTEEKKNRRKSLLAPVQNLFSSIAGEGSSPTESPQEADQRDKDKKSKKGLFGTKREKGLDFQTALQLDDSQAKLQKERQKKLQKELDKIEKEKAKQEKARQTRLLDVLQQTLELGEERAQIPMASHRSAFAMPMRPPIETTS